MLFKIAIVQTARMLVEPSCPSSLARLLATKTPGDARAASHWKRYDDTCEPNVCSFQFIRAAPHAPTTNPITAKFAAVLAAPK